MNSRLITIVLVLFVVGVGYLGYTKGWFAPDGQNAVGDHSGVSRYDSEQHGLSFSYSDRYKIEERDIEVNGTMAHFITLTRKDEVAPENGEGGPAINVAIFSDLGEKPLADWLSGITNSTPMPTTGWDYQEGTIAGETAIFYSSTGLYEADNAAVARDGKAYLISAGWLTREDQILKDYDALLQSLTFK